MAKDLKAFMKRASEDKGLAKKVNKAKNEQELRSIMANEGFELTDSDINNVSGGVFGGVDVKTDLKDSIIGLLNINSNKLNQEITNAKGSHDNVSSISGSQTINSGRN